MLEVHRPYPGVALVAVPQGTVLFGAPADAFKATKRYCNEHKLPFPRVLVAPQRLVAEANPQFAPEFFLYDFLFVYGAAFKPELDGERLALVLDADQVADEKKTLAITLNGPSRGELAGYRDAGDRPILDAATIDRLARVSEHMAIKKGSRPRAIDEMIVTPTFDRQGMTWVLDGAMHIVRTGPETFRVRAGGEEAPVDLSFMAPVVPYATLPPPAGLQTPSTFGVKPLGTRSGFDLSGPTTGFLFWVNGRALIYDGPVGTRYILERQGINPSDIGAVVLSHCHEDHMGAFVELILGGQRPRVYTTEPIYRSMLVKLAHHFRMRETDVAAFVDYERVTPGQPVEIFGAQAEFFYTVHSIPTIGMALSMKTGGGVTHRVQISGDTMGHEGLDKMLAAGAIDQATLAEMKSLVPGKKVDDAIFLADVGEALIHGHPKDWQDNPNRVLYYHCPEDDRTRGYNKEIARPGDTHTLIEAPRLHPALPGRLLYALAFLDFKDPEWLTAFLHRGRTRKVEMGEVVIDPGAPGRELCVVVSGAAEVIGPKDEVLATLHPGEVFGAIELIDAAERMRGRVRAITPLELFVVDGGMVHAYLEEHGTQSTLVRVWANRPNIDSARLFRTLDTPSRNRIAAVGVEESYAAGAVVFNQGAVAEDFFLLVLGKVAIEVNGKVVREIAATDPDNFFGEISAIFPNRRRNATVRAVEPVKALRLRGTELRALFEGEMAVRYNLLVAIKTRS